MSKEDGWSECVLKEGIELISGRHIQSSGCNADGIGMPYLTGPEDFPFRHIQATKFVSHPDVVCKLGDILLVVKGSGTGRMIRADRRYCISRQLMAIRSSIWNNCFLEHFIRASEGHFSSAASGLIPGISRVDILQTPLLIPPLPQQRKIAKILTTVDNLIEKTEALIAKYQSIKQGMMHDLFTRGVDAKGKLRPQQSEAPELYKQSELGWIPKEWEVGSIASISTINPSVSIARFDALTLVSFLTMSDVSEDGRILNHQIRNLKDVKNGFTRFEEGDILFAKITPCMENGKGALAKNLQNKIGFGSTEFHVIRANEFGVPAHIYHLCQSKNVRAKATNFFSGSAGQQRVDSKFFFDYQLPVFSINEQRQIAALLSENDLVIVSLQKGLLKYKQLKTALMQDLLTGKVQVTPDTEDKELAHA